MRGHLAQRVALQAPTLESERGRALAMVRTVRAVTATHIPVRLIAPSRIGVFGDPARSLVRLEQGPGTGQRLVLGTMAKLVLALPVITWTRYSATRRDVRSIVSGIAGVAGENARNLVVLVTKLANTSDIALRLAPSVVGKLARNRIKTRKTATRASVPWIAYGVSGRTGPCVLSVAEVKN